MRNTPGGMRNTPGGMQDTPGRMRDTPGRMRDTPLLAEACPPHAIAAFVAPRKLVITFLLAVPPPRRGRRIPGEFRQGLRRRLGGTAGARRRLRGRVAAGGSSEEVAGAAAFSFSSVFYFKGSRVPGSRRVPAGVVGVPCSAAAFRPAPWRRWTQTELTRWHGGEEEEEEEEDDFERRMDEDGVIGLGEAARSPPWGDSEDLEEGSPADEGRWHPRQDLAQEDEERGSSGEDEGPWGAESDGEPYPELSSEGRWAPPVVHSPRPESPALVESPRGTAGDSEGVAGGLPWPLWHKQRQVEEDFRDLLEQYQHFKSLPESLSLEQLSLAESGSQEEVDAATAGDGGPSKVPCRTRSLEEGANIETLPLASAKPPVGVPGPPRVPLSRRSSGTGSAATQHGPRKEQRIVSPETDSGFVGSEASRVSPPVHTPEHHPAGTGYGPRSCLREFGSACEIWGIEEEQALRERHGPSSPQDAAPSGDPSPPVRGRVAPGVTPTWRERSASLPRHRPELDLGLEEPSGSRPASLSSAAASGSEPSPAGPRAPPSLRRHRGNPPGAVTFRGQCTGTRYQAGTPRATPAPREEPGTSGCPRCHRGRMASAGFGGGDATWQPQHSTPRRTSCPTCRAPMGAPGSRDRAASAERGPGGTCPPGPRVGAEKPEQRGLWYLAATPAATAATVCLAPVPLVPYVPSMLYCSPTVPTSAPALAGVPLGVPARPRQAEST
ncbi:PREDICTED: AT-hook-containing transcription factor, partial [Corvus brachyrhynchos]|uniref:AT-hook-containing transcription factor n=1 Tax=Corvus brachyrhynchos TaxID=85066 RepID=UPI00081670C7